MQEIIQHLKDNGYEIDSIIPDGKLYRFGPKRKSHWYIAHQNFTRTSGEKFYVVIYGDWSTGEKKEFCTLTQSLTQDDKDAIKKQIEAAKKKNEQQRLKSQEEARAEVDSKWAELSTSGTSAYLARKSISDIGGIRFDGDGNLYVPMRDHEGVMWSMQKIQADGGKFFFPGARVKGCFHELGDCGNADTIYVSEGYSTAVSVYMATATPVAIAFNSGNLPVVALLLKRKYKDAAIIILGDDDRWTKKADGTPWNPGREKAEEAASKIFTKAIFPTFKSLDGQPTDWNDLHCREGVEAVRSQLGQTKVARTYLTPLGFREKEYFFTSSQNQQIVAVTAFSKTDFLNLMPIEYWEACYPGQGKSRVDWDTAASNLMLEARRRGIFESQNIRGAGVWNDDGRVVVNMGDHLIVDGHREELGEIKSRYFYTLGIRLPGLNPRPLSVTECEVITNACESFKWKRRDFGYLLAGALVTTRVCGALPIRPHVWLTGERGSGKTTLFNRLIYPVIGKPLIFAGGNTSEAGIRQEVSANAVPVLFDEFENNGPRSSESIQSVLDLMRLSWSETNAAVIKGSSSGVSTAYRARFAAIVTSIRQVSMTDADRSRFATLELSPHENDLTHWKGLEGLLDQIDEEFGNRLFARTINLLPVLLDNFRAMKAALARRSPGQRFGDQYGMLLAGYGLLLQDEPMNTAQADVVAQHVTLDEEREEATLSDQESALTQLLTTKVAYDEGGNRKEGLIGDLIHRAWTSPTGGPEAKALSHVGVRVDTDSVAIVCGQHAELEARVYRGTAWSRSWGNSLRRLPGAEKKRMRIGSKPEWAIQIPIGTLKIT